MSASNPIISLPPTWDTIKRKSTCESGKNSKRARKIDTPSVLNLQTIHHEVTSKMPVASDTFECNMRLQLNDIESTHNFEHVLQNSSTNEFNASIAEVSRAYEEQYLRECLPGEEPCAMGSACECMVIDPAMPFVGTRFVIPDSNHADNNMCLLCLRKTTQLLFHRVINQGFRSQTVLQRHGNICNKAGEYHPSAMLICPPGGPVQCMPIPIVAHQRNRYAVIDRHGIKFLSQHGVGMEDFQEPPPPINV